MLPTNFLPALDTFYVTGQAPANMDGLESRNYRMSFLVSVTNNGITYMLRSSHVYVDGSLVDIFRLDGHNDHSAFLRNGRWQYEINGRTATREDMPADMDDLFSWGDNK